MEKLIGDMTDFLQLGGGNDVMYDVTALVLFHWLQLHYHVFYGGQL